MKAAPTTATWTRISDSAENQSFLFIIKTPPEYADRQHREKRPRANFLTSRTAWKKGRSQPQCGDRAQGSPATATDQPLASPSPLRSTRSRSATFLQTIRIERSTDSLLRARRVQTTNGGEGHHAHVPRQCMARAGRRAWPTGHDALKWEVSLRLTQGPAR